MRWRLFEGFQKSIPRWTCEHMNFVQNVDLEFRSQRKSCYLFAQIANIFNTAIAGRIKFVNIFRCSPQFTRNNAGKCSFSCSPTSHKNHRVRKFSARKKSLQLRNSSFLTNDFLETSWTVGAIEGFRHDTYYSKNLEIYYNTLIWMIGQRIQKSSELRHKLRF